MSDSTLGEFERSAGIALWRQIAERLRSAIAAGEIAEGGKLPTEAELAVRFGVNRHTVRRAIGVLAEDNVVRSDRGRGTFVISRPIDYPIGTRTRFSEIVASQSRQPDGRLIGSGEEAASVHIAEKLNVASGSNLVRLETLSAADGVPLGTATNWFPADRFSGLVAAYAETGSITKALARHGVGDYTRVETRITARVANGEDAQRLGIGHDTVVIVSESVNVDEAGVPIQYCRTRFAADRVQIVIKN